MSCKPTVERCLLRQLRLKEGFSEQDLVEAELQIDGQIEKQKVDKKQLLAPP